MAFRLFVSSYDITIDDKGRIRIPAKYKALLDDNFVVCYGDLKCLAVYPSEKWDTLVSSALALSPLDTLGDDFLRNICPTVADCKFDSAGRVLIPVRHREYANLTKDVVAVGVGDHFELWDSATWYEGKFTSFENRQEIRTKLAERVSGGK